jgi:hypothetical protein
LLWLFLVLWLKYSSLYIVNIHAWSDTYLQIFSPILRDAFSLHSILWCYTFFILM